MCASSTEQRISLQLSVTRAVSKKEWCGCFALEPAHRRDKEARAAFSSKEMRTALLEYRGLAQKEHLVCALRGVAVLDLNTKRELTSCAGKRHFFLFFN